MSIFDRWATLTASTKRTTLTSGKSASAAVKLTGVKCLPLMTVDAETRNRAELQTFAEIKETFVNSSLDIIEGDILTISGVDYPIRAVEEWPWIADGAFRRLIIEELKR